MAEELRFDNQTVVVTGAGRGLGRAYALLLAARGANVVVNDLGASFKGVGSSSEAADSVVAEIQTAGGKAVANYDDVVNGDRIIDTAIKAFGRIDVLINNAGILRGKSLKNMKDEDWDLVIKVHVTGAYKCTKAAWSHFKKQKYGRIINTSSTVGLFGSFGHCNYSAAKAALIGFTETLAREGAKYNIICNAIAPVAASRLTETVMAPDELSLLNPKLVAPLVAVLVHPSNTKNNGGLYEAGGGHMAKFRWERSRGLICRPDETMTPGTILQSWNKLTDFSNPSHPTGPAKYMEQFEQGMSLDPNRPGPELDFKGRVFVITGGSAGLGRAYSLFFASRGAKVVVNGLSQPDKVVDEIRKAGGDAQPAKYSVEDGESIINVAIKHYGRIDVLINNAGIVKDKSFASMTDDLWDPVVRIHLRGTYACTKAAWPYFQQQKYGRILNTASTSGIYGNFGQANYATAKGGIIGFTRALALEGKKYNIHVNVLAPSAGTEMNRAFRSEEMFQALQPRLVAPIVAVLCSDVCPEPTGGLYEACGGWHAQTRWQRSGGVSFPSHAEVKPESVAEAWEDLIDFTNGRANYPRTVDDSSVSGIENSRARPGKAVSSERSRI